MLISLKCTADAKQKAKELMINVSSDKNKSRPVFSRESEDVDELTVAALLLDIISSNGHLIRSCLASLKVVSRAMSVTQNGKCVNT